MAYLGLLMIGFFILVAVSWLIVEVFWKVSGLERKYTIPTYDHVYKNLDDGRVGYRRSASGFVLIGEEKR